jgi:hypothetical protein
MPQSRIKWTALLSSALILSAGCHGKQEPDTSNFKTVINQNLNPHLECVWSSPVKFPVQVDASNDTETKGFDALTDAGLLTRKAEEKKRFLIGSKQVTDYDVSDKGRGVWTVDQSQPGYGNFCYGHREVASIDTFTTGTNSNGANTATVNYHFDIAGVPDWARSPETQTAFPQIQAALSAPQPATANLVQAQSGWQITAPPQP